MDDPTGLAARIKDWGRTLGFQQTGIASTDLATDEARLAAWLTGGRHGEMAYMARHGTKRSRPAELVPGTRRVIVVRLDYYPEDRARSWAILDDAERAFVSRYALGRDYHKVMRRRLQVLADRIGAEIGAFGYRVFVDSGPVLEKPLARAAGLVWVGKHTNLINRDAGSWFFLGVLYTDLELPVDEPVTEHCGSCSACIDVCPTQAIDAPYQLDARRCISYLTIENPGPIPDEFRAAMGNRIYGCDDCQLVCPWNKYATRTNEADFAPRHGLDDASLVDLFAWDAAAFDRLTEGSAIRRIGHERWLRNLAVALGNAPTTPAVVDALHARADDASPLVREHVAWALARHTQIPAK